MQPSSDNDSQDLYLSIYTFFANTNMTSDSEHHVWINNEDFGKMDDLIIDGVSGESKFGFSIRCILKISAGCNDLKNQDGSVLRRIFAKCRVGV